MGKEEPKVISPLLKKLGEAVEAEQKMVKFIITKIGEGEIYHSKNIIAQFKYAARKCKYRGYQDRRTNMFKCNNPDLEDPHFGWACSPDDCPYMNRALDWRANNMTCNVWTEF